MALNSVGRFEKSSQTREHKEATHDEASDEESDDGEMTFIIKRFQHLTKKKNKFSSRSNGFKGPSSRSDKYDQNGCFNCQKPGHFIDAYPDLQKDKVKKESFQKNNFRSKFKKSLMLTWEELDNEEETNK